MQLAEFILANIEPILVEWEAFARSLVPGAKMTVLALRDDAESILRFTARDMRMRQTLAQQSSKSKGNGGRGGKASDGLDHASSLHGAGRVGSGFHVREVVAEYRALRASVLRLWSASLREANLKDIEDIKRFDESLDQSLASAVESYSKRADESRNMFLAILGHDLRNPLGCIRIASHLIAHTKNAESSAHATSLIDSSAGTIAQLIDDLVDYSSGRLGRAMPLNRGHVNLNRLCLEVIDAYRTTNPGRTLRFQSDGEVIGMWDATRLRQVVSNLVGNAIQHGSLDGPVDLSVACERLGSEGSGSEEVIVALRVHNEGAPIPPDVLPTIFDPLVRHAAQGSTVGRKQGSIGLGLFIVREIVAAKRGTVEVTSTAHEGTTFTVRIPQFLPVEDKNRDDAQETG